MNWRTVARIGVAIVGLGVAATVFVLSQRGKKPAEPTQTLATFDPKASLEGGEGQTLYARAGRTSLEIRFKGSKRYDDGRMRFESAQVTGLDENKSKIRADVIETAGSLATDGRPSQFDLSGHVVLEADDGLAVETDKASYDDATGVLKMPGAVTFRRGRLSGRSVGAVYDRANDTITLEDQANARVEPGGDGRGGAEASARRMKLVRGQHSLLLEEQARIVGQTQTLTGHDATVVFTEDEQAVKYLELRGGAQATPSGAAGPNQPGMSADSITMSLQADGLALQHATLTGRAALTLADAGRTRSIRASWIDLFTATDGRTVTALQARDRVVVELPPMDEAPARTITAATLNATGDDKRGLTEARFEGSPRFEEGQPGRGRGPAAVARAGTATTIVLALAGQLDAIDRAEFRQNAHFVDEDVNAWADFLTYEQVKEIVRLQPNPREPRRLSRVSTPDITVDASEIDLFLQNENLNARGAVTTRMIRTGDRAKTSAGSLFDGGAPVWGSAETLEYRRESRAATYTGSGRAQARLKQGETEVAADRIEFSETTNDLRATGRVDSTMQMTVPSEGDASRLQAYRVQAETFVYEDARRQAEYRGATVTLTTKDGKTEAGMLSFELEQEARTLRRMRAEDQVFATLSGGYEFDGDVLVYRADEDMYTLTGRQAKVKARAESAGEPKANECTLTMSLTLEFNKRTGAVQVPGQGQAPRTTKPVACDVPIRSRK